MTPPDQGLGADDAAGRQADTRLIVQDEFAVLERLPEPRFHDQSLQCAGVHRSVIEQHAAAPGVLGAVHRRVGIHQQRIDVGAVVRVHCDPNAGAHIQFRALHGHRLLERRDQAMRSGDGVGRAVQIGQHHDEFVAAEAGNAAAGRFGVRTADRVVRTNGVRESRADHLEQFVTCHVA